MPAWPGVNGKCAYQAAVGVSMALAIAPALQQEFWLESLPDEDKFFSAHDYQDWVKQGTGRPRDPNIN